MVKISLGDDDIHKALTKKLIVTKEEFIEFIETHEPPEGYVWAITPFGAPPGKYKIYLKKFSPPKYSDTDLERCFERILNELGFREGIDYQKQYLILGKVVDFAFLDKKIVFEPGATYWHTPKGVKGIALKPFGFSPDEVYFPPKKEDIEKNDTLSRNGWTVVWINEKFVNHVDELKNLIKIILFFY